MVSWLFRLGYTYQSSLLMIFFVLSVLILLVTDASDRVSNKDVIGLYFSRAREDRGSGMPAQGVS